MKKDQIIIALDMQDEIRLDNLLKDLSGVASYVKVGMELYYTFGNQIIKRLKDDGFKVFLDLKMHDIPSTVYKATKSLAVNGIDMLNVHAAGGRTMMRAAMDGLKEVNEHALLIGVTQLTSTDQKTMNEQLSIPGKVEDIVLAYATLTANAGLNGVVCSALESRLLKDKIGKDFLCVTPGIRPAGIFANDQKRVMTPLDALENGSDYLVIGRAITEAKSPKQAYLDILKDIS